MELDLIDTVPEAVVRAELRRVLVREPPPLERLAGQRTAELRASLRGPAGALALERLDERRIAPEEVVPLERRRLVHRRTMSGVASAREEDDTLGHGVVRRDPPH